MDILSGAGALLGKNKQLAAGLIETTRLKDANQQEPSKSVVQSVEFHPAGQLLLTAGLDKRLRLFQVLPSSEPKCEAKRIVAVSSIPCTSLDPVNRVLASGAFYAG